MRSFMYRTLSTDEALTKIVGDRIYSPGAAGKVVALKRPFVVIRAGVRTRPFPMAQPGLYTQPFAIWQHDEPGSMSNLDAMLEAITARMDQAAPAWVGLQYVMEARHEGDSDDLYDDGFGTQTRFSTWRLTWRK